MNTSSPTIIAIEFRTKKAALDYLERRVSEGSPYQLERSACSGRWILELEQYEQLD